MGDGPLCLPDPRVLSLSASPLQVSVPPRSASPHSADRYADGPALRHPSGLPAPSPGISTGLTPSPPAASQDLAAGDTGRVTFPVFQAQQHQALSARRSQEHCDQAGKVICEAGKSIKEGGSGCRSKPALAASTSSLAEGRGGGRLRGWGQEQSWRRDLWTHRVKLDAPEVPSWR